MPSLKLRLAFREEGEFWNCYIARENTMKDAHLIGSIKIGAVLRPDVKRSFMETMKLAFGHAIEQMTGAPPDGWEERKAPRRERVKSS